MTALGVALAAIGAAIVVVVALLALALYLGHVVAERRRGRPCAPRYCRDRAAAAPTTLAERVVAGRSR